MGMRTVVLNRQCSGISLSYDSMYIHNFMIWREQEKFRLL